MDADTPLTLLNPTAGLSRTTCGYCSAPGTRSALPTSISFGIHPTQMSCAVYQRMIDRGWRRSGTYAYKPDMGRTCCPQYAIRLDTTQLRPSKSQKQALKTWNRFVLEGNTKGADVEMDAGPSSSSSAPAQKPKHKGRDNAPFSLLPALHASEVAFLPRSSTPPAHKFEVELELAGFSEAKFALYRDYQEHVHKDEERTSAGFKRFLCQSPLIPQDIPYPRPPPAHLPRQYGSYHQKYTLDGTLVALGVIDVLPACVSSVYFMYARDVERWGMGKISALREAALAREMHEAGLADLKYLYMGYYIHTCQKMRYKGDYAPSELLDPEAYTWHALPSCVPLLDKHRYVSFSHPPALGPPEMQAEVGSGSGSSMEDARQAAVQAPIGDGMDDADTGGGLYDSLPRATAGCADPLALAHDPQMAHVSIVLRQQGDRVVVGAVTRAKAWRIPTVKRMLCDAVAALGWDIAREVVFSF